MTNVPNSEWINLIQLEWLERQIQPQTILSSTPPSTQKFKQTVLAIACIHNTELYKVRDLDSAEYFQLLYAIKNEVLQSVLESALLITDLQQLRGSNPDEPIPTSCDVCVTIRSVTKCDKNAQNELWSFLCSHYPITRIVSTTVLEAWSILNSTNRSRHVVSMGMEHSSGLDNQSISPFLHVHQIPALFPGFATPPKSEPNLARSFVNSDYGKLTSDLTWPDSALLACLNHLGMQIFDPENTNGFQSSALYALGVLIKMHAHALCDVPV